MPDLQILDLIQKPFSKKKPMQPKISRKSQNMVKLFERPSRISEERQESVPKKENSKGIRK